MTPRDLTPRQYGVIADYMAAGNPLAVAALAAGVMPPVAATAIGEAPWFGEVLEASRALQAMVQPDWLDRVRRMMRGVIERAVAEERVSLLHLAARQTDAMTAERFDRDDEKHGVDALLHAMASMTHAQLDEWQVLTQRGPAWAERERAAASKPATPEPSPPQPSPNAPDDAVPTADPPSGPARSVDPAGIGDAAAADQAAASPAAGPQPGWQEEEPEAHDRDDVIKAAVRERCPWPGSKPETAGAAGLRRSFYPDPTPEQAGDPLHATPPPIRPPQPAPQDPWPYPYEMLDLQQGQMLPPRPPGGFDPTARIPVPRVVLAKLTPGRPVPDWIVQEPPGGRRQQPP